MNRVLRNRQTAGLSFCKPTPALADRISPRHQNGHFVGFKSFARFFSDLSASPLKSPSCRTGRRERPLSSVERGHAFPVPTATRAAPGSFRVLPQVPRLAGAATFSKIAFLCCCCCRYSALSWLRFASYSPFTSSLSSLLFDQALL